MTQYARIGAILFIALALWGSAVSAVHAEDTDGGSTTVTAEDLQLTKTLKTGGSLFAGDEAVWEITIRNNADVTAENVQVTEDLGGSLVLSENGADPHEGTYEGSVWTIDELLPHESATLTLTTTVAEDAEVGKLENCVKITSPAPAQGIEPVPVCTSGKTSPTVGLDVTIKPETLNLKSRGVFTVFIRFSEETTAYSFEDLSLLECGGAPPEKLHVNQKDGGTLMAKYRRQQLKEVAAGEEVTITCEVTLTSDGESVKFAGSDTLRVIGEKKKGLDAFFSGILDTILPVGDEGDEVAEDQATTPTATDTPALNRGQLKKQERNQDGSCTENCDGAGPQDTRGNGKKAGTDDSVTGSDEKGNQGKGNDNNADNGDGKGNGNKPDKNKGNSNNKK